jgi:integrase
MRIKIRKPGEIGKSYYYDFTLHGTRYRGAIPDARNMEQAKLAAQQVWDDIFNKKYNPAPPEPKPLFADFVKDSFLPYSKLNKRTYDDDVRITAILCDFFNGMTIDEITPAMVEKYKQHRSAGKTRLETLRRPATVNRELSILSRIFTLAVDAGELENNPCRRVKNLRMDNERSRYLSKDEEKRLMAALEGQEWLKNIVVMALHTGMRRGEIFNLQWFDVDFTRDVIQVRQTKTGKNRIVPMNKTVSQMLERLPKASGYVFPSPKTGGRMVDLKGRFMSALSTAKIKDFRFHDLRHTAATRMGDKGADAFTLASILGHSDIRMTARYTHATDEAKHRAVGNLVESGAASQKTVKKAGREKGRRANLP